MSISRAKGLNRTRTLTPKLMYTQKIPKDLSMKVICDFYSSVKKFHINYSLLYTS